MQRSTLEAMVDTLHYMAKENRDQATVARTTHLDRRAAAFHEGRAQGYRNAARLLEAELSIDFMAEMDRLEQRLAGEGK